MKFCGSMVVVLLSALSGCTLTQGGSGDDAGVVTDTGPKDVIQDVPVIPDSGPDVVEASTCNQDLCPGKRCVADECSYFATCTELHTARASLASAVYQLKGPNGTYFAYCDMDLASGGWTLVGRSVALATSANFGWFKAAGDPSLDNAPYSFDMANYTGSPKEALVGVYTANKTWGAPVYKITLPANGFPAGFGASSVAVTGSAVVQTTCGAGLATDLAFVGYTSDANSFYFDPTGVHGALGLTYAGFALGGVADCAANGEMDAKQGQIFVR